MSAAILEETYIHPRVVRRPARRAARLLRLERPQLAERRELEELRQFPAALLDRLPAPVELRLRVPGHEGPVRVTARRERDEEGIVFDHAEWNALVVAAESDRMWAADMRDVCANKARMAGWSLDLEHALAGARADAPRNWTVGAVLTRIGAELTGLNHDV